MAGIDRRRALRLLGGLGVAGLATACGADDRAGGLAQHETPVRIGMLLPATGGYRSIGDDIRNGFRHYLTGTGARLGGHPVTELEEDEGDTPEAALAGVERLLAQDVHALVGMVSSRAILEISATVERAHVPLLSAYASPAGLTGVPYIWRTSFGNQEPALALGRHLVSSVSGQIAVLAQDDPMGADSVAGLQEAFAAARGSDQLAEPIFTPDEDQPGPDHFAEVLGQLSLTAPAAVFSAYAGSAALEFVRQYLDAGLDPGQLYGPAGLTESGVLAALGEAAVGIQTSGNYAPELRGAANRGFAVDYRAQHGPASPYAVAGYDAAAVLDTAIRLTGGDPVPRQVNLTLGEVGLVDSPRGRWQFNQNRTPTQKWFLREVAPDGPTVANLVVRELGTLG